MREEILREIKRLARGSDGIAPGVRAFENATSIKQHQWHGVYWTNWTNALEEAGFSGNAWNAKLNTATVLREVAQLALQLGKFPTNTEILFHRQTNPSLPTPKTIKRHFDSSSGLQRALNELGRDDQDFAALTTLISPVEHTDLSQMPVQVTNEGWVYLLKSGDHFKIGRGGDLENRVKQITTALPEATVLFHAIKTDDPSGIEAYWHRRFADRRLNGEWFKLSKQDVAAFKRWQKIF